MALISVVIPIYKTEEYLEECVESVRNQSFKDIEIILVNDGSPDNCRQICDEYKLKDSRIKVIHKKNGGLSDARNYGIKEAKGEYIIFLDSDDYWEGTECLANIVEKINQGNHYDMIHFSGYKLYKYLEDDGIRFDLKLELMDKEEVLLYLVSNGLLNCSACMKILNRKFILENDLFFEVGLKSEDIEWIVRVCNKVQKHGFINEKIYVYRQNVYGSISSSPTYSHLDGFRNFIEKFLEFEFENDQIKNSLLSYCSYHYIALIALIINMKDKRKYKLLKRLKNINDILEFDLDRRVRLAKKLNNTIGFYPMSIVLNMYLKLKHIKSKNKKI